MMRRCPLCNTPEPALYHQDRRRDYYQCATCALVFVPAEQHLDSHQEKAEYDQHQNSPHDTGYRHFLGRLFAPLVAKLPQDAHGLDFGCGPGPTLSVMFEEAGFAMAVYDIFYAPDVEVLNRQYDFITATEVLEHLARLGEELSQLVEKIVPGGYLGVMTKRVSTPAAFARWHYINDPTHVSFFSEATFCWIAERWGMVVEFPAADVVLLRRRPLP